jgi:hypothetical protein
MKKTSFKDLFNKEFLFEETKKSLNIFYKFNINIKKLEKENPDQAPETPAPESQAPAQEVQTQAAPETAETPAPEAQIPAPEASEIPSPEVQTQPGQSTDVPFSSIVTEDDKKKDDNIEINDDNNIVRKIEGQVVLDNDDVDNIQTVEDMVQYLVDSKQDGVKVLDDFSAEIIKTLISANAQQVSQQIDKSSSIFCDIFYGYEKDDSVGIRIIKRKDNDSVSISMLVDNQIVPTKINNMDMINDRIVNYRNEKFDTDSDKNT